MSAGKSQFYKPFFFVTDAETEYFSGTNTLAYFVAASVTEKKSFITSTPGSAEHFYFQIY